MEEGSFYITLKSLEAFFLENVKEDILFYSIALAAVIGKMKESAKKNLFSAWIIYLMGTLFHELSHFLVSLVTYGRPFWFSLVPSSNIDQETGKKMITLGYVKSKNVKWWNVFFISMSPLLLFPLSFWVYDNFFNYFELNLWTIVLYVFSIVSLLFSAIPSGVDLKNVFNSNTPINLLVPFIFVLLYFAYFKYFTDLGGSF